MILTKDDLQAISVLIQPINERLEGVENRLDGVDIRLDKLDSEVKSLRIGQIEIRTKLNEMDQKISDTYELALDAWGKSTENRMLIGQVN